MSVDYWENILRNEAKSMKSLTFFKSEFMSIACVHPIFALAGNSPMNVAKATIQALMLSGRYRCGSLTRHWDKNYNGFCKIGPQCQELEDIHHILKRCQALHDTRIKLSSYTCTYARKCPQELHDLILEHCQPEHPDFSFFVLDCSTLPAVIQLVQKIGKDALFHLFHISRTWIYALHRERLKLLGLWKSSSTTGPHRCE